MSNEIDLNTPRKEVIINWINTPIIKLLLKGKMYSSLEDIPLINSLDLETRDRAVKKKTIYLETIRGLVALVFWKLEIICILYSLTLKITQ